MLWEVNRAYVPQSDYQYNKMGDKGRAYVFEKLVKEHWKNDFQIFVFKEVMLQAKETFWEAKMHISCWIAWRFVDISFYTEALVLSGELGEVLTSVLMTRWSSIFFCSTVDVLRLFRSTVWFHIPITGQNIYFWIVIYQNERNNSNRSLILENFSFDIWTK